MAARRSLESLKVTELRTELDIRNEDSSGLKTALVSRMKEALKKEGKDPDSFELNSASTKESIDDTKCSVEKSSEQSGGKGDEGKEKNCEENSSLIVHVGDATDDLDYDLTGKREADEDNKDNANSSDQSVADGDAKANSKNLWVANMPKNVKAAELRSHFSAVGKVLAARVFLNKAPGAQSKCYGLVQMATVEDADRCVKALNRTMLAGQRIYVDKAKTDLTYSATKRPATTNVANAAKKIATSTTSTTGAPAATTSAASASTPASSPVTSKKDTEKKESTKVESVKKEKVEVKKESEKKSTSTVGKDKSDVNQIGDREKAKLEMVKKKEEDLEKLKQRQLQLAKTQRLEFDRLAREKEKLRHEREAIERERRNLRRIRKEVEGKTEREGPSHRVGEDRYERRRSPEPSASATRGRTDRPPRYQGTTRDSKPYSRPSAPSGSDRRTTGRAFDNEPRSNRPERERENDNQFRRQDERQEGRYDSNSYSGSRSDLNSGHRYNDYGGESSRMRSRGYELENRQSRGGYEQSTSKYKKEASSSYSNRETYETYSRDYGYNSDNRRQATASYYKDYNAENDYSRDRSPQRSSDRYGGGSSSYGRQNPYYSSTVGGGSGEHGMTSSHRGSSSTVTSNFLGGSSSNLGGSSAPSSSSPMFLGGGGSTSGTAFPPSGSSYYGAATLAASALANSAAASSMRYDAYAAAAAASGRNMGGSVYHHRY